MIREIFRKIVHKICQLRNILIDRDDFNWAKYHLNYKNQVKEIEEGLTLKLSKENFEVINKKLNFKNISLPLSVNHELLYKIIYDLKPSSILEVGCGGGDHLSNLKKIMSSKVNLMGCDLLPKQLNFLIKRNPELKKGAKIFVHDITISPIPKEILKESKPDLIYTQAVIMHIQKGNNHLKALRNLFYSSSKYVVLMENWTRHNFYEDILKISREKNFPWGELSIYKADSGKQVALVLSKKPLKNKSLKYESIKDNQELLKYER